MNFINSINTLGLGIFCSFLFAGCLIYPLYVLDLLPPIAWFKWCLLIFAAYFTINLNNEQPKYDISFKVVALGLILFLPLIIANLYYDRVQISHHGWYHNAYVLQILQDIYPLKNVNAPGIAPTTYFSFHYLIATFSEAFDTPSFRINAVLNCFSLWITFLLTGKILRELNVKLSPLWCFVLVLIVLFNGNLFGSLFYIFNVLSYDLNLYAFDIPWQSEIRLIPATPVADYFILQLSTIYSKFFNYSGVPLGIAGFLFSLYNMILFRKNMNNHWILLVACVGTFFIHTTIGLFTLLVLPLALCIEFLINKRISDLWNFTKKNILFVVVAVLYAGLVGHYILSASSAFGVSKIALFQHPGLNLRSLLLFNAPLIGFIFLATKYGRNIDLKHSDTRFLLILLMIGGLMSWCITVHVANQYKFMYFSSIIAGFLFAILVKNRKWILFTVILIICNLQIVNYGFHFSQTWSSYTMQFEGVHSVGSNMTTWIRQQTLKNTSILAPMAILNEEDMWHCGRLPYIKDDPTFVSKALLEDRTSDIENFYKASTSQQQEQFAQQILEKSESEALTVIAPQEMKLPNSDRFQKAKSFDEFDIYSFE